MSRFLRDLGLLVLSVLAAVAVLLILVNPGAKPGLAVSTAAPVIPATTIVSTTVPAGPTTSVPAGQVTPVLSISNRGALCGGGEARFTVTLIGPGALDPGRAAIEVRGIAGLDEIELESGTVSTEPPSVVWSGSHLFTAEPAPLSVLVRVVRIDGPPLSPVELNEPCT
ncbi:MAG: hypothetical protein GY929_11070 [Actinomycetia bacterium]|nr:hypothetical protein [Actinomycetes bacterium]